MIDWTTIVVSIGTALISSGGIGGIMFYRLRKQTISIDNDAKAAKQWQALYMQSLDRDREKDAKIDALHDLNGKLRDHNNALETENARLEMQKCRVNGCMKREPPRGF